VIRRTGGADAHGIAKRFSSRAAATTMATMPRPAWVTRGMVGIVLATFFSDVGHEMVTAVLPLYLTAIGLGPAALGVMEGAAELAFSLSKLVGGFVGHHTARKKGFAAAGYTTTAMAIAGIGFVTSVAAVGALRTAAWLGRGFRSPLRDFLLADEVEPTHFGRAYGIERAADMLGAVAGPLVALGLLATGTKVPTLIVVSVVPSLLAVAFLVALTQDRGGAKAGEPARPEARLPRAFWIFVGGVSLFGLGDFSRTFLIFLVADKMGSGGMTAGVLAYAAHNVVSGLAAFPAGRLGDRIPKWKVLATGYALGVVTNVVLAGASTTTSGLAVAVLGSGVYVAVEETVEKAAVAELLPREERSFGFGVLACANAVGDMVSSVYVGALLSAGHAPWAFTLAAIFSVLGATWIAGVGLRRPSGRSSA